MSFGGMKTHGKISGSAVSAFLDNVNKKLEDYYYELDRLCDEITATMRWVKSLRDETSELLTDFHPNYFDPKQEVEPEVVEKITELVKAIDQIHSDAGNLLDITQEVYASSEHFEDVSSDWQDVLDELSEDEEASESAS